MEKQENDLKSWAGGHLQGLGVGGWKGHRIVRGAGNILLKFGGK